MSDRLVYVRSAHSKLHVAVMHGDELLTPERCNLDDVTGERRISDEMPEVDPRDFCRRCFPGERVQPDRESVTFA